MVGILNGVDYREWDPRHDPHLTAHFGPQDLRGKRTNKELLIAATRLELAPAQPLIGMVTRLAEQKGIDLLFDALPRLLQERDFGLVVLGSGDERYAAFFEDLARRFPGRVAFRSGYDESLAHLIEAGSDMFLMPSRYEPCGLNQMYSLRYGTIPIVRKTGGLADSVQHFDPATGAGTGCVFNDYELPAVRWAVGTALDWFADPKSWQQLMQNAMAQDFSWSRQIVEYDALYRGLLGRRLTRDSVRAARSGGRWAANRFSPSAVPPPLARLAPIGRRTAVPRGRAAAQDHTLAVARASSRGRAVARRRDFAVRRRHRLCRRSTAAASIGPGIRSDGGARIHVDHGPSGLVRCKQNQGLPAASCSMARAIDARSCQASTWRYTCDAGPVSSAQ